jgi:hypothetical protein
MGVRRAEVMGRPLVLTHITSERKWFGVEEVRIGQGRRTPHYYSATPERVLEFPRSGGQGLIRH